MSENITRELILEWAYNDNIVIDMYESGAEKGADLFLLLMIPQSSLCISRFLILGMIKVMVVRSFIMSAMPG